ncbi:MAG: YceI family protein [Bacteroidetes bacterium]|jgi:polyisoprenoid-binding protein YceI|nr:YceI family protein [Bacteroidota bacterium]MBT6687556.1 YceI family protein [Bacteroidota bacterium]MBT7142787.1 YceI family protein [Bacteroidota bacterium]MBT7491990.1 YceI family protein [Bacteroidota bacterium]
MKKLSILSSLFAIAVVFFAFTLPESKLVSSKTHIKLFSHTAVEDIEANNNASVSTFNLETGDIVFSVPMQSFEFEKSLMQKHFNSKKFLETKEFPKAKFKAKITNLSEINFSQDGTYPATVKGDMTIKGVTKSISENGKITISGNKIEIYSKFNLTLADYEITFVKGKPSSNIAKTVEVTLHAEYQAK